MDSLKMVILAVLILSSMGLSYGQVEGQMNVTEGENLTANETPEEIIAEVTGEEMPANVTAEGNVTAMANLTAGEAPGVVTPSVTVMDQAVENGTVTVSEVVSDGPGWMVIHADQNGTFGQVIGHEAAVNGTNADVVVQIQMENITDVLYAMLHIDAEPVGTYDFPGSDVPVIVDGMIVMENFTVTYEEMAPEEMDNVSPAGIAPEEMPGAEEEGGVTEEAVPGEEIEAPVTERAAPAVEEPAAEEPAVEGMPAEEMPAEEMPAEEMPAEAAPVAVAEAGVPSIQVEDQDVSGGQVTVASVTASEPGWVVIREDENGLPREIIGYAQVDQGVSSDVVVEIDAEDATPTLHAILHRDGGEEGTFEFPGADTEVRTDDGDKVQVTFNATA